MKAKYLHTNKTLQTSLAFHRKRKQVLLQRFPNDITDVILSFTSPSHFIVFGSFSRTWSIYYDHRFLNTHQDEMNNDLTSSSKTWQCIFGLSISHTTTIPPTSLKVDRVLSCKSLHAAFDLCFETSVKKNKPCVIQHMFLLSFSKLCDPSFIQDQLRTHINYGNDLVWQISIQSAKVHTPPEIHRDANFGEGNHGKMVMFRSSSIDGRLEIYRVDPNLILRWYMYLLDNKNHAMPKSDQYMTAIHTNKWIPSSILTCPFNVWIDLTKYPSTSTAELPRYEVLSFNKTPLSKENALQEFIPPMDDLYYLMLVIQNVVSNGTCMGKRIWLEEPRNCVEPHVACLNIPFESSVMVYTFGNTLVSYDELKSNTPSIIVVCDKLCYIYWRVCSKPEYVPCIHFSCQADIPLYVEWNNDESWVSIAKQFLNAMNTIHCDQWTTHSHVFFQCIRAYQAM